MTSHFPDLAERVHGQRDRQHDLYGDFDFDAVPHRFTTDPADESALPSWVADRAPFLADDRLAELMRTTTFLGDVVADPYATLSGTHGVKALVEMLQRACRSGVESVPEAPPELIEFIAAMEATPAWVDLELVRRGARAARVPEAFFAPFILRGAFLATFTNTYAALPMTLTGALTSRRATHRVHETASFFSITALPGALDRFGPGFEAAAMVRLMHSMVRVNALTRSDWDASVFGLPVPQIDQMPAGLIGIYILARAALLRGRTEFTPGERAILEFSRYRCFLLGLPEELLPTTVHGVVDMIHARAAFLRDGFDDATCGELVRSTMAARLRPGNTPFDLIAESVEKSWSKVAFSRAFCNGDRNASAAMSVPVDLLDLARVGLTAPFVFGRIGAVVAANRQPVLREAVDRYTTRVLRKRLAAYGVPEFTTDAQSYPTAV